MKLEPGAGGTRIRSDNINLHTTVTAEYAGAIKFVIDQIPVPIESDGYTYRDWGERGRPYAEHSQVSRPKAP